MSKDLSGCGECAYVQKEGNTMWCPFHDLPTGPNKVCDDFLDEFESPQWVSLAAGMNGEKNNVPKCTGKDIFAYAITFLLMVSSLVLCILAEF